MKKYYLIFLILFLIFSFIPFREDLLMCRVYDSDSRSYELWEKPMIRGLETYPSEELAQLPFSLVGGEQKACYSHKWYSSLDGLKLINKPINSYSLVDKIFALLIN